LAADDGVHGWELWKSNGRSAGTVRVRDIRTGAKGSSPRALVSVSTTVFFTADDGAHGSELC
jgi:ELWxxDGT repeat protein